jgi:hypothetical protein
VHQNNFIILISKGALTLYFQIFDIPLRDFNLMMLELIKFSESDFILRIMHEAFGIRAPKYQSAGKHFINANIYINLNVYDHHSGSNWSSQDWRIA